MLVYGDASREETVAEKIIAIDGRLGQIVWIADPLERHAALVGAFIAASELVQGIGDAEFASRGVDARSEAHEVGMRFLIALARCVNDSWVSGFTQHRVLPGVDSLSGLDPSQVISVKRAEGYAFYALYPESFLVAASRSGLPRDTQVIGISVSRARGDAAARVADLTRQTFSLLGLERPVPELWIDDRKLFPGDYNRAEAPTGDKRVWSETGCTCVLITSTRDVLS